MTEPADLVLLPYQRRWAEDRSAVKVYVKTRRCGITWTTAVDSLMDALGGVMDTWYVSHTQDGAAEFMADCGDWCRKLGLVHGGIEKFALDKDGRELAPDIAVLPEGAIQALRIRFPNGKRVSALSSNPRRLRGKTGRIILDEFAAHPDPEELLKAAIPILISGGRIEIISTHAGEANHFNKIVEGIRSGDEQYQGWSLHQTDFDEALAQGLGKRFFSSFHLDRTYGPWSPETEKVWRDFIVRSAGVAADEELFCRPSSASSGTWFHRDKFQILDSLSDFGKPFPKTVRRVRGWDWAATVPSRTSPDPDWTVGVLVSELDNGNYVVEDVARDRLGPADVDALLYRTAQQDGSDVEIMLAQDPGAGSKADLHAKMRLLSGYRTNSMVVSKGKDWYAKPWASIVARGDLFLMRGPWNRAYLDELHQYPPAKGGHDDQVDATSYAFQELTGAGTQWTDAFLKGFK